MGIGLRTAKAHGEEVTQSYSSFLLLLLRFIYFSAPQSFT